MRNSILALALALAATLICIAAIILADRVYRPLHRWIKVFSYKVMALRAKPLLLHCVYCSKELTEPEMYAFRGWVGCEQCIRDYYRYKPQEMEFQLQTRRSNARVWLARNHKVLQKGMTQSKSKA